MLQNGSISLLTEADSNCSGYQGLPLMRPDQQSCRCFYPTMTDVSVFNYGEKWGALHYYRGGAGIEHAE
jgi:hypothetical protein